MRDEETVRTALAAAETGHLVLSTVHTVDATESVNRILDFFPPHQHAQARAMIAGTFKGVVSQRLIPSIDGSGRVAVCEILVMTGRGADMVKDPSRPVACTRSSRRASTTGCRPSTRRCSATCRPGRITMDEALRASTHPHDFKLLVAADGRRSTTMSDLADQARRPARSAAAPEPAPRTTAGPPARRGALGRAA